MYFLAIALGLITIAQPTGFGFIATYGLLGAAIVAALGFSIFNFVKRPATAVKTLIGIAVLVILYFIGQSITPAEPVYDSVGDLLAEAPMAQYAGASVFVGGTMLGLTFLAFILSEIIGLFR